MQKSQERSESGHKVKVELNNQNMIKKYKVVIAVVMPIFILIIIRSFGANHFQHDAKKWAELSFRTSNIIKGTEIEKLPGEKLIVYLDTNFEKPGEKSAEEVFIPPDSVLYSENLNKIRSHKGPVLLYSSDPALSARIWMIISQTGCTNLYILTGDSDNEVFKNEFRPDTLARPEL
jgi:hypothetical protein